TQKGEVIQDGFLAEEAEVAANFNRSNVGPTERYKLLTEVDTRGAEGVRGAVSADVDGNFTSQTGEGCNALNFRPDAEEHCSVPAMRLRRDLERQIARQQAVADRRIGLSFLAGRTQCA